MRLEPNLKQRIGKSTCVRTASYGSTFQTPQKPMRMHMTLIFKGVTTLESMNFRDTYDIFSTPKVFVLDVDKRIIATKLSTRANRRVH